MVHSIVVGYMTVIAMETTVIAMATMRMSLMAKQQVMELNKSICTQEHEFQLGIRPEKY